MLFVSYVYNYIYIYIYGPTKTPSAPTARVLASSRGHHWSCHPHLSAWPGQCQRSCPWVSHEIPISLVWKILVYAMYMYKYIYIYTHVQHALIYIYVCVYIYIYTLRAHAHTCIYLHIYIYIYICMQYKYIYIHTFPCMQMLLRPVYPFILWENMYEHIPG